MSAPTPPLTTSAFPRREAQLKDLLARAKVDPTALARPLSPCQLNSCRATCCHDGVHLGEDEPSALLALLATRRAQLDALLPTPLPAQPLIPLPGHRRKTATRPDPTRANQPGYPGHFPLTSCVFLMADARCSLQSLASSLGHHPWHFKPFTCWLHPLSLVTDNHGVTTLTIHTDRADPDRAPAYPGFVAHTPCGAPCTAPTSQPAHLILSAELATLSHFANRDILSTTR